MQGPPAKIPPLGKLYNRRFKDLSPRQATFYADLKRHLCNGYSPDVQPWTSYLFLFADELVSKAPSDGFRYTLYMLLDLAEAYYSTPEFATYCKRWAYDCLLALEEYEEFLLLSEPIEPFGTAGGQSNLRLNVELMLGREGSAIDLFKLAGGKASSVTRQHPGIFREILGRCFEEDAAKNGPWLQRIIEKPGASKSQYEHRLFGLPGLKLYCFYAAYEFDSRRKRFRYNFNDVIADCGRRAENLLRDELKIPRMGEGWVAETTLYHALRDAFPETAVIHHGRPNWLGRQHFDVWLPQWKVAVEYHGEQHFQPIEFFGGAQAFDETVARDKRKSDAALRHGVQLIVVTAELSHSDVIASVRAVRAANKASSLVLEAVHSGDKTLDPG